MADKSAIEWTDATWNPVVGCTIVSPGCTNCYAMKVANGLERRFDSPKYRGLTKVVNGNAVWTGEVRLDEAALLQPLKWKRGRRIFVNSMSDLFHEALNDADIDRVFAVMALCPQHTFQVLTKRAERMREYCSQLGQHHSIDRVSLAMKRYHPDSPGAFYTLGNGGWHFKNVWLGVSAERQTEANERIPELLATPAAVRFVSIEPLLGSIDLMMLERGDKAFDALQGAKAYRDGDEWEHEGTCAKLDWVIGGGESGPKARPMHPQWARDIRDQCQAAGVPFFFKQFGEWAPESDDSGIHPDACYKEDGTPRYLSAALGIDGRQYNNADDAPAPSAFIRRVGKKAAGRLLDGKEHNEFPLAGDRAEHQRGLLSPEPKDQEAST